MARDVQTNLTIAMQTKGFDKGMREMLGVNQKALEGLRKQSTEYGKAQKSIDGMRDRVQDLAKQQMKASTALGKITDKAGAAYKYQEQQMKRSQEGAKKLTQEIKLLEQAHAKDARATQQLSRAQRDLLMTQKQARQQSRLAFTQGLLQTAMPGMAPLFLQRGPGMGRQFLGQQAGGLLRRAGRFVAGAAQAPFAGVGGLQQAVSALPGGAIVAGQIGAMAQHAQAALGWQRQRLGMAPLVETGMPARARGRLGEIEEQLATVRRRREGLAPAEALAGAFPTAREGLPRGRRGMLGLLLGAPKRYEPIGTFQIAEEKAKDVRGTALALVRDQEKKLEARETKLQSERRRLQAETPGGQIQGMGREFMGVSRQQAAQTVSQLLQVAGGRFVGAPGQRQDVGAAMAAQTMYGVGPQVAGAFLGAGRRGGLVGGRGRGGEALAGALQDAVALGLEGSEITQYMEQMAQGIQQFLVTGIPINKESIKSMGLSFSEAGIGAARGGRMARGMQQYIQNIGQRGISGGLDLMLMQAFGGFKGGGPAQYEQAIMQMEMMSRKGTEGVSQQGPMGQIIRKLVREGGGVQGGGISHMRRQLGQMMPMSAGEARAMTARAFGMDIGRVLTPAQAEAFGVDVVGERRRRLRGAGAEVTGGAVRAFGGVMPPAAQALMAAAAGRVGEVAPHVRTATDLANEQLVIGRKSLTTMQNLERASRKLNTTFVELTEPALKAVSKGMLSFAKMLNKLARGELSLGELVFGVD